MPISDETLKFVERYRLALRRVVTSQSAVAAKENELQEAHREEKEAQNEHIQARIAMHSELLRVESLL